MKRRITLEYQEVCTLLARYLMLLADKKPGDKYQMTWRAEDGELIAWIEYEDDNLL